MKRKVPEKQSLSIAVIESDPLRVAGFRALLESHKDIKLLPISLPETTPATEIDVAILGKRSTQSLSSMMQFLMGVKPGIRVIVTGASSTDDAILEAIANGAKGYVNEAAPASEFVNAIRAVKDGLVWAPRRVVAQFIDRSSQICKRVIGTPELTIREKEVLEMLVAGRSNKEIAAPLGIEERTVKAHVAKMMRKVGVHNRITLSVQALNRSLVPAK